MVRRMYECCSITMMRDKPPSRHVSDVHFDIYGHSILPAVSFYKLPAFEIVINAGCQSDYSLLPNLNSCHSGISMIWNTDLVSPAIHCSFHI